MLADIAKQRRDRPGIFAAAARPGATVEEIAATYNPKDKDRFRKARAAFEERRVESGRGMTEKALEQPFDMSFMTPELKAAQDETTLAPIRRSFSAANRRGFQQSLRTGSPVGAMATALAGGEADAIRQQSAQNFLTNTGLAFDVSGRRVSGGLNLANFAGDRSRYSEEQIQREKDRRAAKFGAITGAVGDLAGAGLALAFPPAGAAQAGRSVAGGSGNAVAGSAANRRRFSLQRRNY
jgi:hypothetical protein